MRTDAREVGRWLRWAIIACLALTSGCTIPGPYSIIKKVTRMAPPETPLPAYEPVESKQGSVL
jgi:hypothetical protein